ncbi:IclR family transcriptional regulator [Paraburkholderia sp. GAS334]|uniref:IclR family transcriptional regulator n=1 Tax=Paraburkholderia sp. GAS334 TaxID=3035131 RepID=UPI003D22FEE4
MLQQPTGTLSPLFNQSLEKGLAVLRAFDTRRRTMTLTEIAEAADISKSSAQRIVFTLETLGLLQKHPRTRRFQLTTRVMSIGCNYLETSLLIDSANPFLAALSSNCGETVALTEPDGLEMVYVARFPSHKHIPIHMPIGRRMPMYCTASGRAYLSGLPDDEVLERLKSSDRRQHTPNTCVDIDALHELVASARTRGLAFNNQEYFIGDINVAAPVINSNGRTIAAVHVAAPSSRWTLDEAIQKLGPMVIECARSVSNASRTLD